MFWYIPFATISSSRYRIEDESERIFWGIFCTVIGVCLRIGADTQKFIQLKFNKGLISDGFYTRTRNPNYLGEMLIYSGFGIIAKDDTSWWILIVAWFTLFGSGILQKELSFMKMEGWEEYKNRSLILLPRITPDYWQNYMIYAGVASVIYFFYTFGGVFSLLGLKSVSLLSFH